MDRTFWRVIANDENALPQGEWVAELAPELLSWLGSTDAELRDEFAYRILAAWVEREQFQAEQLHDLVRQMLDNLHIGLGERDTDSVFLRSYSTLVLMEVVAYDNAHPFLGQGEAASLLDQVLEYLRKERDLRSWVEGPGWAHAVAHTADLLMMLARNLQLGTVELERLLDGIADRLLEPSGVVFVQHEDERLAYAALNVLRRGLVGRAARDRWLERFVRPSRLREPDRQRHPRQRHQLPSQPLLPAPADGEPSPGRRRAPRRPAGDPAKHGHRVLQPRVSPGGPRSMWGELAPPTAPQERLCHGPPMS